MDVVELRFSVDFRSRVTFTRDLLRPENPALAEAVEPGDEGPARCAVVVDSGVAAHHPGLLDALRSYADAHSERIALAGPPRVMEGGEACKNDPSAVDRVLELLDRQAIDRHAYVVAIGGGALLDMVGFAAGTCHRGVRLVRVPTTVLAQNDSGVGVKNSVNRFGKKNFLGTFAPANAVLVDPHFLTTLDDRDWCAGTAEAMKVALLKDAAFFAWMEEHADAIRSGDLDRMARLVRECAVLHTTHIATSGDPFEMGSSRPLDFGHWAAHKLEQLTEFALRHGEAVAIGLALDVAYSHLRYGLPMPTVERILLTLQRLGLPLAHPALYGDPERRTLCPRVYAGLEEFRQHLGGRLTITLIRGVGEAFEVHEMDADILDRAVQLVAAFADRATQRAPASLRATP